MDSMLCAPADQGETQPHTINMMEVAKPLHFDRDSISHGISSHYPSICVNRNHMHDRTDHQQIDKRNMRHMPQRKQA